MFVLRFVAREHTHTHVIPAYLLSETSSFFRVIKLAIRFKWNVYKMKKKNTTQHVAFGTLVTF